MTDRREAAFAAVLALVLAVGVVGVLLLNTAMQQQSHVVTRQQARLSALAQQSRLLQARVDRMSNPALLAAKARRLHLRPARRTEFVGPAGRVSGRRRGTSSSPAG